MKRQWSKLFLTLLLITTLNFQSVQAAVGPLHTYVPIGSGYSSDTLQRFARASSERDTNGIVDILVIPITFATDAFTISNGERQQNLTLADNRRGLIENACNAVKLPSQTCRAVLAPVLVRDDAYLQSNLDLFVTDMDGMYILGGDQTIAMQVVANTPFEESIANAFHNGAVVSGNSAGAAVESLNMIGGYTGNNGPENGFQQGSVDLWLPGDSDPNRRGLSFGMTTALLDQHEFQRGRIARLINASFTTGLLGIGADADTAIAITDESTLTDVTGATAAIIIDLQTYNATGRFAGPTNSLAIHGVTTHLIPPGGFGYDLTKRRPLVDGHSLPAPTITGRSFDALHLPSGYGPLILSGDVRSDLSGAVTQRFAALSGGSSARLVVVTLGYAKSTDAQADAKAFAAALQTQVNNPVQWFVVDSKVNQSAVQNAIATATGILVSSPDQSRVMNALTSAAGITSALQSAWASGKTILADNAAAAAPGQAVSTDPTPSSASLESDSMEDFLFSGVNIQPGLNWIPGVVIEPRMVMDRHWGRAYNHLYRNSALLGFGVDVNTAIEFISTGAQVWGRNTVVVFDGRYASYALGTNDALSARYVILDTYVEGDTITP
ncbi:MAG TPA: Type 1 glutamine amidotransferase-like domain-containing protein [Anaerolineales bacterium]|nr:Type 1 glutamine amidotransferase-like domain-containing protein [Anaerolineales bacterium]